MLLYRHKQFKSELLWRNRKLEMRNNASINVNIQIDGKSENMILKPVMASPAEVFKTKITKRFKQMWIENLTGACQISEVLKLRS